MVSKMKKERFKLKIPMLDSIEISCSENMLKGTNDSVCRNCIGVNYLYQAECYSTTYVDGKYLSI